MGLKRLDKLIALNCNVSRKEARTLIKDAAVTVNGRCVLRAEELVDVETDDIAVKGYNFTAKEHIYIMLNKPQGVISATNDPRKETVIDIIPPELKRRSLFPCGRLDRDTTGLLIITDDGALAHRIMSPSHHVYKTYEAILKEPISNSDIAGSRMPTARNVCLQRLKPLQLTVLPLPKSRSKRASIIRSKGCSPPSGITSSTCAAPVSGRCTSTPT